MNRKLMLGLVVFGLISGAALMLLGCGAGEQGRGITAPGVAAAEMEAVPISVAAPANAEPPAPSEGVAGSENQTEKPKTGCGRPEPCPGRSCEDCPHNRLL
jgi:hypothetical protein